MAVIRARYAGKRWNRVRSVYTFFKLVELEGRPFSLEELCKTTGYCISTAKAYLTKRWKQFVQKRSGGDFVCHGILEIPWERFAHLHSQVSDQLGLDDHLVVKTQVATPSPKPQSSSHKPVWIAIAFVAFLRRLGYKLPEASQK